MDGMKTRGFGSKLYRWFKDPSISSVRKLTAVAAVAYLLMPVDLVPDVIPLIGWLDDLGVLTAAGAFISREVRRHSGAAHGAAPSPSGRGPG